MIYSVDFTIGMLLTFWFLYMYALIFKIDLIYSHTYIYDFHVLALKLIYILKAQKVYAKLS